MTRRFDNEAKNRFGTDRLNCCGFVLIVGHETARVIGIIVVCVEGLGVNIGASA